MSDTMKGESHLGASTSDYNLVTPPQLKLFGVWHSNQGLFYICFLLLMPMLSMIPSTQIAPYLILFQTSALVENNTMCSSILWARMPFFSPPPFLGLISQVEAIKEESA